MTTAAQKLHLIIDPVFPSPGADGVSDLRLKAIEVPDGPARLVLRGEGDPTVIPEGGAAEGAAADPGIPGAAGRGATACYVEPVRSGARPELLMLTGLAAPRPGVNGHPAPPVCLLEVGDQVLLHDNTVLHITVYNRPPVGPASSEVVGRECLLCRKGLTADDTVYTCACGALLHFHSPPSGTGEPLECARVITECTRCMEPIVLAEGFAYVPDIG